MMSNGRYKGTSQAQVCKPRLSPFTLPSPLMHNPTSSQLSSG